MHRQFNPYSIHTAKFLQLLDQCRTKKNPALWLHENDARSTLFMLESISRIWYRSFNDEITKKWYRTFKKLEDLLGEIENYSSLFQKFSKNRSVTKIQIDYFKKKKDKALEKLNRKLTEKDFFKKFMIVIRKPGVLSFNNKTVLLKLQKEIKAEIEGCFSFFNDHKNGFTKMESQVHELRRNLRWISMYGQSLNGIIILKDPDIRYKWEKEFVPENAADSVYNKLPVKKDLKHYIFFNKKAFFALTYVIGELGKIKDEGLAMEALTHAIEKTAPVGVTSPKRLANKELQSVLTGKQLLQKAHQLSSDFFIRHAIQNHLLSAR